MYCRSNKRGKTREINAELLLILSFVDTFEVIDEILPGSKKQTTGISATPRDEDARLANFYDTNA